MKLRVMLALLTLGSLSLTIPGIGFADTKDSGFLKDDIVIKKSGPHNCSRCCCAKQTDKCNESCLRNKYMTAEFLGKEHVCREKAIKDKTLKPMCDALNAAAVQTNEGCVHECETKESMEQIKKFMEHQGFEFMK